MNTPGDADATRMPSDSVTAGSSGETVVDFVLRFDVHYLYGRRAYAGAMAPHFGGSKRNAHGFETRLEADREREILEARTGGITPKRKYEVEERTAKERWG